MSVDRFAILRSNPHPTKHFVVKGIVPHLENLPRKGGCKGFNLERRISRSGGRSFISF
jgi:hypothetical protein